MKKLLLIISVALGVASCNKGYVVTGNVEGVSGKVSIRQGDEIIAETETSDGRFTIKGILEHPEIYTLGSDNGNLGTLLLENGARIDVSGKLDGENSDIKFSGTTAQDKLYEWDSAEKSLFESYEAATPEQQEAILSERESNIGKAIEENLGNMFGVYLLRSNFHSMEPAELMGKLDRIPAEYQTMKMVDYMRTNAEAKLNTDMGKPFVDFSLTDMAGNQVALSSVVGEGKYVLLDFWASWCGPCIRELPYIKAAYDEYHPKGFEIFGVSLDSSREAWVECIDKNEMNWYHVSALEGWDCPAAKLYGVASIPASYLIGPDGVILAKNLRGEELSAKLAELLNVEPETAVDETAAVTQ